MSLGVCGLAIPSELGTLPLRSQTQGVIGMTQVFFGWVVIFTTPYMINPDAGNLGGKVMFVFFGFGLIFSVLLFLYLPETKGLSYEEVCCPKFKLGRLMDQIDYCFNTKTNARKFQEVARSFRAERELQGGNQDSDGEKAIHQPIVTENAKDSI